jgi:MFS family permease
MKPPSRAVRALVAIAAALALADASIVALALPPILAEMHTTVTGVAAIIGVYAFVLGGRDPPAERLVRRFGPHRSVRPALALFAAASLACAVAPSLTPLLVFRAFQALGGAAGLLAAFDILDAAPHPTAATRLGAALAGTRRRARARRRAHRGARLARDSPSRPRSPPLRPSGAGART